MIQVEIEIINESGLHARPSSVLVKTASKFKSNISLAKDGLEVNGKSILGVMSIAAEKGSKIVLRIDGEDEQLALDTLLQLAQMGFKEQT
ncbi:MAG: HPr family phosphocarrier protein [Patescibacteria group bacterium]|nr:HPr family phosphocarrier protein [Patescibacteria group bacterium]